MSSFLYPSARTSFAKGYFKWRKTGGDTFKAFCVLSSYVEDRTKVYLSEFDTNDLCGSYGNATSDYAVKLKLTDPVDGACGSDPIIFAEIPAGKEIRYILIFKDTGEPTTSDLVALCDITGDRPPILSNGANIGFNPSDTANKIFKL